MLFVVTFCRKMKHIGRISHVTALPVGDIFSESTTNIGLIASLVSLAEIFETGFGPVPHRYHDFFLVHIKFSCFIELQTSFPSISEAIGPFAGKTVFFMPDKFFCPEPALFAQGQNQFHDIGMSLAIDRLFFDI